MNNWTNHNYQNKKSASDVHKKYFLLPKEPNITHQEQTSASVSSFIPWKFDVLTLDRLEHQIIIMKWSKSVDIAFWHCDFCQNKQFPFWPIVIWSVVHLKCANNSWSKIISRFSCFGTTTEKFWLVTKKLGQFWG